MSQISADIILYKGDRERHNRRHDKDLKIEHPYAFLDLDPFSMNLMTLIS